MAIKPAYVLGNGEGNPPGALCRSASPDRREGEPVLPCRHRTPAVPLEIPSRPSPSLRELAHLVQLQRLKARRRVRAQSSLRRLQVASARTARLVRAAGSIQRTLADCIRSGDKQSFVKLLDGFSNALDHCTQLAHSSVALPCTVESNVDNPDRSGSFLDGLPLESCDATLAFLTKIRSDGTYLAQCVSSLTHRELLALLPIQDGARSSDSVFKSVFWSGFRASGELSQSVDTQVQQLLSGSFSCPLELLVHATRKLGGDREAEDVGALTAWSAVCAHLVAEQKPGCEKFVPAVLDTWVSSSDWLGKERLGLWEGQILQDASFLAFQPIKQTFQARASARAETMVEDDGHVEAFYSEAVISLLELLGDQTGSSVIPESVLRMCHAIWHSLQDFPSYQRVFPQFIVTRWLFSTFVPGILTLPEAHGLLTDHHITDIVRQRILREVANRAQQVVLGVVYSLYAHCTAELKAMTNRSRRYGTLVSSENTTRVQAILRRFQPGVDISAPTAYSRSIEGTTRSAEDGCFLALTAADVRSLINALHPQRRTDSVASDQDGFQSGLRSSASSISGFSLFKTAEQPSSPSDHLALGFDSCSPTPMGPELPTAFTTRVRAQDTYASFLEPLVLRDVCGSLEATSSVPTVDYEDQWVILNAIEGKLQTIPPTTGQAILQTSDKPSPVPINGLASLIERLLAAELENDRPAMHIATRDGTPGEEDLGSTLFRSYCFCISRSEECHDFVAAHTWSQDLQEVQALAVSGLDFTEAFRDIQSRAQQKMANDELMIAIDETQLANVVPCLEMLSRQLLRLEESVMRLRDKMWFVVDVRISGPYDQARSIVNALRVMGKPKRQVRSRLAPPLRHWSSPKVSNAHDHLKSEAQILDLLSTSPNHGGPNKLSDDQATTTLLWMQRNSVENVCRGEERLHRLCMEIRKCVDHLLSPDSAALLQNPLFAHDDQLRSRRAAPDSPFHPAGTSGQLNNLSLHTYISPSIDTISGAPYALSTAGSQDQLDSWSPALTSKSSSLLWSQAQSPSSATSVGSYPTRAGSTIAGSGSKPKASKQEQDEELWQNLMSLLISDLGGTLFNEGSETDRAFWTGLSGELIGKHFSAKSIKPNKDTSSVDTITHAGDLAGPVRPFNFDASFCKLLKLFSATYNLSKKLSILHDMDRLMPAWIKASPPSAPTLLSAVTSSTPTALQASRPRTDASVEGFRRLFSQASSRPAGILRDLQYIAALVPSACLESTPQGKAFWNAAVAILGIKQQARSIMVETADSIIAFQSNNRGNGRSSSSAQQQQRDSAAFPSPGRTPPAEDVSQYTMADAAYLLQIAAKEGEPVAQRELATLYLTHPELMDHVIAPFASPKEVFKEESESKWRRNHDRSRCDPTTMCVAHHWMSLSSKGGDALAKKYLRQREEMEKLP